ncbi:hypothetical protein M407DRAFT_12002 [Tulasnella calospora MUT 4182]|uniref:Uncharacterized protein n=1 Tax=Tulasnella calospora MUT 4182 TaxID=1051891 RepID=A0A0C3Q4H8_9AGAM|nr:hypothetical protein M407DRAFT_12002 [Tulasnella calospora MUT 4182]
MQATVSEPEAESDEDLIEYWRSKRVGNWTSFEIALTLTKMINMPSRLFKEFLRRLAFDHRVITYTRHASIRLWENIILKYYNEQVDNKMPFIFIKGGELVKVAVPGLTVPWVWICDLCNAIAYLLLSGYLASQETYPQTLEDIVNIIGCIGIFIDRFSNHECGLLPPRVICIVWARSNTLQLWDPTITNKFVLAVGSTLGGASKGQGHWKELVAMEHRRQLTRTLAEIPGKNLQVAEEGMNRIALEHPNNTGYCTESLAFASMMRRIESPGGAIRLRSLALSLRRLRIKLQAEEGAARESQPPRAKVISLGAIHRCFRAACGSCVEITEEADFAGENFGPRPANDDSDDEENEPEDEAGKDDGWEVNVEVPPDHSGYFCESCAKRDGTQIDLALSVVWTRPKDCTVRDNI